MTAEIAVMNREAVALAADSAIALATERGPKVYQSATKIFALSRTAPLGLMVYGSAQFLDVPWDTIAKVYREENDSERFATLTEHAQHFVEFIETSYLLFPPAARRRCAEQTVNSFFIYLREQIEDRINRHLTAHGRITDPEIQQEVSAEIDLYVGLLTNAKSPPHSPKGLVRQVANELRGIIPTSRDTVFEKLPLTGVQKRQLGVAARALFTKNTMNPTSPNRSGIVIAGFGAEEIYPSLVEYMLEGLLSNYLKYVHRDSAVIEGGQNVAFIVPFAQRESVDAFISGMDPDIEQFIAGFWKDGLGQIEKELIADLNLKDEAAATLTTLIQKRCKAQMEKFHQSIGMLQHENYVMPIINAVAMLPKDELGAMAESLVNLTSFKRKVSIEAETVGGPIDVAVISRGDGLVWIKRKHYFDPRLNPQYFAAKFGRREIDGPEG